jgi:hypothetical protein
VDIVGRGKRENFRGGESRAPRYANFSNFFCLIKHYILSVLKDYVNFSKFDPGALERVKILRREERVRKSESVGGLIPGA